MRERRIIVIAVLLSILLSVSLAFGLGVVDISKLPFVNTSPPVAPGSVTISMDPDTIIKDYLLDTGYQIGDKFTVDVNITGVTDLYTWQLNVTWDPSILSASDFTAGGFLLGTGSADKTAAYQLGYVINATDNAKGYACISESILGEVGGESGEGQLVTIEFEVVYYGCTNLTISTSGDMPTTLLDSTGNPIDFTTADGWFKNKLIGDSTGDGAVNILDRANINAHWYPGPPVGSLGFSRCADVGPGGEDGAINILDRAIVNANWGRSVSLPPPPP